MINKEKQTARIALIGSRCKWIDREDYNKDAFCSCVLVDKYSKEK